jgi:hypothetical protein
MGNLVQRVWKDDRRRHVAAGFSVIVPRAVRGQSRALIRAVLDQPNIAAGYTLNANPTSAPLYARHGMSAWPARTSALKLSWIVDPIDCLRGRLLREAVRRAPHLTDPYRERFLRSDRGLGRTRPPRFPSLVSTLTDLSDGSPFGTSGRRSRSRDGRSRTAAPRSCAGASPIRTRPSRHCCWPIRATAP